MKPTTLKKAVIAAGSLGLLAGSAFSQTAISAAGGYETIQLDQQFNFIGLRLVGVVQGTTTVSAITGTSITLDADLGLNGDFLLSVNDNTAIGNLDRAAVAGTAVTTDNDLAALGLAIGDSVTFREFQTLESVFGPANASSLDQGGNPAAGDHVLLPDGAGGFDTYYIFDGGFGGTPEWRNQATNTAIDPTTINLFFSDGIVVQNRGAANTLVVTGMVMTNPVNYALNNQFEFVSWVYPVGLTLDNSGLFSQLDQGGSPAAGDNVNIPDGAGGFNIYYIFDGGFGGTPEWRNQVTNTAVDPTTVSFDSQSGGYILNRGGPATALISPPAFYANL